MEIRDPIHGSIVLHPDELPIIESAAFQRLRQIKQLGFGETSFPSATHNRYIHSLGAMETVTQAFEAICRSARSLEPSPIRPSDSIRFRIVLRLAALLHDVGHGPLSHSTEFAMPPVSELSLPLSDPYFLGRRQANHEDYTLKIILDSSVTRLLKNLGDQYGFTPEHIAALLSSRVQIEDDFFVSGMGIQFRPLLQQLISSEIDADRMDYLRRDSFFAGVSYGQFDFNWLVSHLTCHVHDRKAYLAIEHRALYALEDFLISRYHMFLMIYFHHKTVIYDEMLSQYLLSQSQDYQLPAEIDQYLLFNDAHLHTHLAQSKNPWAQRITQKRPYQVLLELHSGIPAADHAHAEQKELLAQIQTELKQKKIHFLTITSVSELSKYFGQPSEPIYVRYDNLYDHPSFIPLEKCTDLFQRYQEKRSVTRLYVPPEAHSLLVKRKQK